jgi:hypothetical protein
MVDLQGVTEDDPKNILYLAGQALHSCQRLEHGIQVLVATLAKLGVEGINASYSEDILAGKSPKPLGQLFGTLFKMVSVNDVGQTWIQTGLTARNQIVHRFFRDSYDFMEYKEGRSAVVTNIKKLEKQVSEVHDFFVQLMKKLAEVYDGKK